MNVLIVEDNRAIQETYLESIKLLFSRKFVKQKEILRVKRVANVEEFRSDAKPFKHIDLALVDWFLNGYITARPIIETIYKKCPMVFVITGSPKEPEILECKTRFSIRNIIGKPVDYYMLEILFEQAVQLLK